MKKPPTAAIATACTAPRSRKASRPFRKSVRRSFRFFSLSPCGRGGLREAKTGEGSRSIDRPQPLIRHGLRPRHLLPQGERGLFKAWIFPVLYQCLAELPSLMLGSRFHIGNEIRLASSYLRHQPVLLLPTHHLLRCRDI